MQNDRRKFITLTGTLGAASLLIPGRVIAAALMPNAENPGSADYRARLKEWFYLHNADASAQSDLKLLKVIEVGNSAQLHQFSLVLRSRRGVEAMPTGFYEVAGEPFSLFIKHTHESRDRQYYSADFALLR